MKKLNLVLATIALMTMATFVMGQSAERVQKAEGTAITPIRRPPPTDPCSPWFVGTVFVPCNTTVGTLVWDSKLRKYTVSLNEAQLKQAYDYFFNQASTTTGDAVKRTRPRSFGEWAEEVRRAFQEFVPLVSIPPPPDSGSTMARPPIKLDLKLDYNGGKLGGSVGASITF